MNAAQQKDLENRLDNWGDWARSCSGIQTRHRCGSAEGRYLTPADADTQEAKRASKCVDHADAEAIEAGVSKLKTERYRRWLGAWYVERANPEWFRRREGIQPFMLRCRIVEAVGGLQAVLDAMDRAERLHFASGSNMYGTAPCVPGRDHPPALAAGGAWSKR